MKLINTKQLIDALIRDENELSKKLFKTENYPIGFLSGIEQSITLVNIAYVRSYDVDIAIDELFKQLDTIKDKNVKCGYYFILAYLHYINNQLDLSLSTKCVKSCYKWEVVKNDWYNIIM